VIRNKEQRYGRIRSTSGSGKKNEQQTAQHMRLLLFRLTGPIFLRESPDFTGIINLVLHSATTKRMLRVAWLAGIVIVAAGSLAPSDSSSMRMLDSLEISDKIQHFAAYALLAVLPAIHERRGFVIGAAIGVLVLGAGLEYLQLYSGWRDFEFADMVADGVGICFGLAVGAPIRTVAGLYRGKPNFSARRFIKEEFDL
jgi:VanZ family protein